MEEEALKDAPDWAPVDRRGRFSTASYWLKKKSRACAGSRLFFLLEHPYSQFNFFSKKSQAEYTMSVLFSSFSFSYFCHCFFPPGWAAFSLLLLLLLLLLDTKFF